MIYRIALTVLLALTTASANANLFIEINRGNDNPAPIAIVPFGQTRGLPENIQQIVAADLERSGFFKPIPTSDMLAMPTSRNEVVFRDWRMLGANFLVIGKLTPEGSAYALRYELYDVLAQKNILTATVKGGPNGLRDIAHAISDAVYEKVTGIRGIFSTKMLYVQDLRKPGAGRYRLVYADVDGARARTLLASSEPILSPTWSPDGKRIAYVSFETSRPAIYIMELATGRKTQMTNFRGLNGAPSFSPDGTQLAMVLSKDGAPDIYTMTIADKRLKRITADHYIDTEPNWSVDGSSVIFTSNRGGSPQIYQVNVTSGRPERLTFEGDYNARPRVSPDGKSLVMVHRQNGVFHIASQDIATGSMRILTETWLDESPSIAPNGAMLLYATQHNNKGVLGAVSMDAGVKFRLPSSEGDVREPAWAPYF
ncbi:MAG TPA: Tol-Pal system beta propeller repeat protein TolB [Marinagarivorans sp.]